MARCTGGEEEAVQGTLMRQGNSLFLLLFITPLAGQGLKLLVLSFAAGSLSGRHEW